MREDPALGTTPGLPSSKMEVLSLHQLLGRSPVLEKVTTCVLGMEPRGHRGTQWPPHKEGPSSRYPFLLPPGALGASG